MRIGIKNIGPIIRADIDFPDKVVIVGANSSGKTFLSTAVYFLLTLPDALAWPLRHKFDLPPIGENKEATFEIPVSLKELIEENKVAITRGVKDWLKSVFGADVKELIRFQEGEGVIEDEKVKVVLHGDDVYVEAKVDEKVKFSVTVVRVSSGFCSCSSSIDPEGKILVVAGEKVEECIENRLPYYFLLMFFWNPLLSPRGVPQH